MYAHLLSIAVAVATHLGYHAQPMPALEAAADVVAANPGALQRPDDETIAIVVYWMHRESAFQSSAIGDGGLAHGLLQLHGACGLRSAREQVKCWLALVRRGERLCPAQPLAMTWGSCRYSPLADRRLSRVRDLLP